MLWTIYCWASYVIGIPTAIAICCFIAHQEETNGPFSDISMTNRYGNSFVLWEIYIILMIVCLTAIPWIFPLAASVGGLFVVICMWIYKYTCKLSSLVTRLFGEYHE